LLYYLRKTIQQGLKHDLGTLFQKGHSQYLGATLEHLTLEQRLEAEKKISDSPILVKAANRLFSEKAKVKFYESKGIKKTA